jgi:opacity protein-like surface antigen
MKPNYIKILPFVFLLVSLIPVNAQDIDQMLEETTGSTTDFTTATFKSTRIINGHSIERMPAGQLDVRISHRFGEVNSGIYNFFGLDESSTHFGLEYGITNWMMAGIGRGTYEKTYDGFFKFSLLRQSKGKRNMPVSLSYLTTAAVNSIKWDGSGSLNFWDRVSYVHQILIARKFNERFSLELNPTYVHRNMVSTEMDPNDLFAAGAGMRFKLTKRLSLNAEYYYVIPPLHDYRSEKTFNPLSIGVDIETGGHVFQLFFTNSVAIIEKSFIGETTGSWSDGGIRFGFNISRVFALNRQNGT